MDSIQLRLTVGKAEAVTLVLFCSVVLNPPAVKEPRVRAVPRIYLSIRSTWHTKHRDREYRGRANDDDATTVPRTANPIPPATKYLRKCNRALVSSRHETNAMHSVIIGPPISSHSIHPSIQVVFSISRLERWLDGTDEQQPDSATGTKTRHISANPAFSPCINFVRLLLALSRIPRPLKRTLQYIMKCPLAKAAP